MPRISASNSRVEALSSARGQDDGIAGAKEIGSRHHAGIDGVDYGGVDDQRPEGLHEVECQRRPAETRLMIESHHWIETDSVACDREVLGQHAVAEREQGVDRVARGAAVTAFKVQAKTFGRRGATDDL